VLTISFQNRFLKICGQGCTIVTWGKEKKSVITYAPDVAAHCALGNMQLYCPNLDHLILGQIKLTLIKAKPHIHSHAFAVWKLRFGVRFLESEL